MLMLKTMLKIISKPIKLKLRMRVTIMMTMLIKMNHREILNKWLIITAKVMTNSTRKTMTKTVRMTITPRKRSKEIWLKKVEACYDRSTPPSFSTLISLTMLMTTRSRIG